MAETTAAFVAAPARTRPKPKPSRRTQTPARARARRRSHAAIAWIVVSAVLLAGVVFVNLVVLRLNLGLDKATQERMKLRASNAALQSQLSAALSSPRIQARARVRDGLEPADQSTIRYVDVGRG